MRLVGEHFKRNGQPKHAYPTRAEALDGAGARGQMVYRCTVCDAWHRATHGGGRKRGRR